MKTCSTLEKKKEEDLFLLSVTQGLKCAPLIVSSTSACVTTFVPTPSSLPNISLAFPQLLVSIHISFHPVTNIYTYTDSSKKAGMLPNVAAPMSSLDQPITILPAFSSRAPSFLPPHDATVPRRQYGKQQFMMVACRRRGLRLGAGARPAMESEAEKKRVISKWDGEEWWEVEWEPESEEEESRLGEALEYWLEEEAMQGGGDGHGGREASDYNRRAHIFDRSSRVFPAIKARRRSPDAAPSSSSSAATTTSS